MIFPKDDTIMQLERLEGWLAQEGKDKEFIKVSKDLIEAIVALFRNLYGENIALKDEIAEVLLEVKKLKGELK